MNTTAKVFLWIIVLAVIAIAVYAFVYSGKSGQTSLLDDASNTAAIGTVCTLDAKMCPDGSYVGRTGPNCEFVCPPASTTSNVGNNGSLYPADIGK